MMYPMALMFLAPLSPLLEAWFPHVIESSGFPPVPNPIRNSRIAGIAIVTLVSDNTDSCFGALLPRTAC